MSTTYEVIVMVHAINVFLNPGPGYNRCVLHIRTPTHTHTYMYTLTSDVTAKAAMHVKVMRKCTWPCDVCASKCGQLHARYIHTRRQGCVSVFRSLDVCMNTDNSKSIIKHTCVKCVSEDSYI